MKHGLYRQAHESATAMQTAEVIDVQGAQAVKLPDEFRFSGPLVSVRKSGEAVILEPVKPAPWPPGFFDEVRIDDPAFVRPDQGPIPPPPTLR